MYFLIGPGMLCLHSNKELTISYKCHGMEAIGVMSDRHSLLADGSWFSLKLHWLTEEQ